jgi:dihydrofolate reductase
VPGDTVFPDFEPAEWEEVECSEHPADERHAHAVSFVTLERKDSHGQVAR